jgi:hypothetical protein
MRLWICIKRQRYIIAGTVIVNRSNALTGNARQGATRNTSTRFFFFPYTIMDACVFQRPRHVIPSETLSSLSLIPNARTNMPSFEPSSSQPFVQPFPDQRLIHHTEPTRHHQNLCQCLAPNQAIQNSCKPNLIAIFKNPSIPMYSWVSCAKTSTWVYTMVGCTSQKQHSGRC